MRGRIENIQEILFEKKDCEKKELLKVFGPKLGDPIKDSSEIIVFEQKEWSAPSTENPSFVSNSYQQTGQERS